MKKYLLIILLLSGAFAIDGYLHQYEMSDCQDACSQYAIHHEVEDSEPINVIFQDSTININLYINRFVEVVLGQEVTCAECSAFEVASIIISEECWQPNDCFVDPCLAPPPCGLNTTVECISNYCGGCYADFYDLNENLVDCTSTTEECFDFSGLDFGVCTMLLGVGLVNGECHYISGCDWIIDGINYSDLFFDSIGECEEVCNTDYQIELGDIDFDGDINVLDVVLLVSFILGESTDEYEYIAADINEDGSIDVLDAVSLIEIILSPQLSDECYIVPEVGPCEGICPTYYYNQDTNECEEFITGCCGVEAFSTLQECQTICE